LHHPPPKPALAGGPSFSLEPRPGQNVASVIICPANWHIFFPEIPLLPSRSVLFLILVLATAAFAQQPSSTRNPKPAPEQQKSSAEEPSTSKVPSPTSKEPQAASRHPEESRPEAAKEAAEKKEEEHYDMTEVPPVVTHHQITLDGRPLR